MIKKLLLLVLFICSSLLAQNTGSISGTIKDKSNGDPLPGVNIILKGTYYGAASDINGKFNIPGIRLHQINIRK
jgi:hypothetical protein